MKALFTLFLLVSVSACSGLNVKQYQNEKPTLDLEQYFNGHLTAHGLVMNRSGEVTRRFVVKMSAEWKDHVGILQEDFAWADGEKSQRVWTIKKLPDGKYQGTAADVIGTADGEASGNAFSWGYKMDLKTKDSEHKISFDDWMYLVDDKVLINEASMSWYGIRVGKILISFTKN